MCVVILISDSLSVTVIKTFFVFIAVSYVISWKISPRYNGTELYIAYRPNTLIIILWTNAMAKALVLRPEIKSVCHSSHARQASSRKLFVMKARPYFSTCGRRHCYSFSEYRSDHKHHRLSKITWKFLTCQLIHLSLVLVSSSNIWTQMFTATNLHCLISFCIFPLTLCLTQQKEWMNRSLLGW